MSLPQKGFAVFPVLIVISLFLIASFEIYRNNKKHDLTNTLVVSPTPHSSVNSSPVPSTSSTSAKVIQKTNSVPTIDLANIEIDYTGPETVYFDSYTHLNAKVTNSKGEEIKNVYILWYLEGGSIKLDKDVGDSVKMEAIAEGKTKITAKYQNLQTSIEVNVLKPTSTEVLYWGASDPLGYTVNGYGQYYLKLTYPDSYSYPIADWSSSDNCASFERVDHFRVKATFVKTGDCTITASFKILNATKTVQVVPEGQRPIF